MTYTQQKVLGFIAILALMFVTALAIFSVPASANPSNYIYAPHSATSTLTYMTPGTATTTAVFDTEANVSKNAADNVRMIIQLSASSTATTLRWRLEYSQDLACRTAPTGVDWYAGDWVSQSNIGTTTTASPIVLSQGAYEYSWAFASTSMGASVVSPSNNRSLKILDIPVYTKCVRAVFYLPVGSANGAVWADFVARKENL